MPTWVASTSTWDYRESEIRDVLEWRNMLGRICAFERPAEDREDQSKSLNLLEENLSLLGINYGTYFGLIEQVVIWGKDLNGRVFEQNELVTLYQLDFCQAFTGWIPNVRKNLRYEAIRRLLGHQNSQSLAEKSRPFVMFLTIRDEIHTESLCSFLGDPLDGHERALLDSILAEHKVRKRRTCQSQHPLLKAFVFRTMKRFFDGHHIRSCFLPPVHYMGNTERDPMVVYTVLGTFDLPELDAPKNLQSLSDFLIEQCLELSGDAVVPVTKCCTETQTISDVASTIASRVSCFEVDAVWKCIAKGIETLAP